MVSNQIFLHVLFCCCSVSFSCLFTVSDDSRGQGGHQTCIWSGGNEWRAGALLSLFLLIVLLALQLAHLFACVFVGLNFVAVFAVSHSIRLLPNCCLDWLCSCILVLRFLVRGFFFCLCQFFSCHFSPAYNSCSEE